MHILLTTYGLLLIFGLYCSAQWRAAIDMSLMDIVAMSKFEHVRERTFKKINSQSKRDYNQLVPKKDKDSTEIDDEEEEEEEIEEEPDTLGKDKKKKGKNEKRSRYLNISSMFVGENPSITDGTGGDCFILLKNLITEMYSGQDFFDKAKNTIPDLEEQFLRNLFEKTQDAQQEAQWLEEANELNNVKLDDMFYDYVRYKMFSGSKSRVGGDTYEDPGYFPLLEFITLNDNTKIMSLWLAPRPLLMALFFQNPDVVQDVIIARHEFYKEYQRDKNKSALQAKGNELRLRFSSYIRDVTLDNIDFEVSTTRPPDCPSTKKTKS